MNQTQNAVPRGTKASMWSFRLAVVGIVLVAAGLIGGRGALSPFAAMLLLALGSLSLIIGGICGGVGLVRSGGTGGNTLAILPWIAVLLGVAAILNSGMMMGRGGAPIHDISTDTADPPEFVAVAELRGPKDNPVAYTGGDTAEIQAATYPDIKTIVFLDPPAGIFDTALAVAASMGWEIVASDIDSGRIEATATTPFAGFKDDVVIRVRSEGNQTLVDVRSKSRIGRGDMGVNAQRIRDYRDKLLAEVNPEQ